MEKDKKKWKKVKEERFQLRNKKLLSLGCYYFLLALNYFFEYRE